MDASKNLSVQFNKRELKSNKSLLNSDVLYWHYVVPIIAIACTVVMWPILSASNDLFPTGVDTLGHLTKVEYLAERWRHLQFSDWFPEWYMGSTLVQYYPPLSKWVGAFIQLLTGNIMMTFKVFTWVSLFLGGLFTAQLAKKLGGDVVVGINAALLYSLSHYTLSSVFIDGTLGRALSLPLYPLLLAQMINLCEKPCTRNWLYSCIYMALLAMTHAMHAYIQFAGVVLFCMIWRLKLPLYWKRLILIAEAALTGIALTGFWAVPGVFQWETPGVPWPLPRGAESMLTVDFFLNPGSPYFYYFFLTLLGALLGFLFYKDRFIWLGLVVVWVVTTSLTLGPKNPIYLLLPLGEKSLVPLRFLHAADLPAAILVSFFAQGVARVFTGWFKDPDIKKSLGIVPAIVIVIIIIVSSPLVPLNPPSDYARLRFLIDAVPTTGKNPFEKGRLTAELPHSGGEMAFFPVKYGFNTSIGWNIEGTVHSYTLVNHNIAYHEGYYQYMLRNWYLWNTRAVVLDRGYDFLQSMSDYLYLNDWSYLAQNEDAVVVTTDHPSTYFMKLHSDVLVIGRSSY